MRLTTRQDLVKFVAEKNPKTSVEVGVRTGWWSKFILDNTPVETHFAVDPWSPNVELSQEQSRCDDYYNHALKLLQPYGERCVICRECSPAAAEPFMPHSVDFVYIDGLHDYESVIKDLWAWYPKVRPGGILAGHDYDQQAWPGVYRAVNEMSQELKLEIHTTGIGDNYGETDGIRSSFWFEIPCFGIVGG